MNTNGKTEALRITAESKRGWTSREPSVSQSAGEKCLLTSPFIEPVIPFRVSLRRNCLCNRLFATECPLLDQLGTGLD